MPWLPRLSKIAAAVSLLALALAAAGCAAGYSLRYVSTPEVDPWTYRPRVATICILRSQFAGAGTTYLHYDNEVFVGATQGASVYFCYLARPGRHRLTARSLKRTTTSLSVAAGGRYFVRLSVGVVSIRFRRLSEHAARKILRGARYVVARPTRRLATPPYRLPVPAVGPSRYGMEVPPAPGRPVPPAAGVPPGRRPPPPPPPKAWGGYALGSSQVETLRRYGCRFDKYDLYVARRLHRRGFTSSQLVQAYIDLYNLTPAQRTYLEPIATYRLVGLPWKEFPKFRRSRRTLTDYYNRNKVKGFGLMVAGWVITGIGVLTTAVGSFLVARDPDRLKGDADATAVFSGLGLVGGVAALAAGLPMGIVGTVRYSRRLKAGLLENGTVDELRKSGLAPPKRAIPPPRVEWFITPVLGPGGGVLTIGLRF